jgi:hypothetical protein
MRPQSHQRTHGFEACRRSNRGTAFRDDRAAARAGMRALVGATAIELVWLEDGERAALGRLGAYLGVG